MKTKQELTRPAYIRIPEAVFTNKNLQPNDLLVYGIVYWFHSMKDGVCFASNKRIAEALGCSTRAVSNSLSRLEKERLISRTFYGTKKRNRKAIVPMVQEVVRTIDVSDTSNDVSRDTSNDEQNSIRENKNSNNKGALQFSDDLPEEHHTPIRDDGRTWLKRLTDLYWKLWKIEYNTDPVRLHHGKLHSQLKPIVESIGEWQFADALVMYLYHKEDKKLNEAQHPLSWFPYRVNDIRTSMKHEYGYNLTDIDAIKKRVTKALSYEQD